MKLPRPIPPRSVVRLVRLWPHARSQGHEVGETRRIGYYSPQDGLDCIWLVDHDGDYNWTADHDWLERHFEMVTITDEDDLFGEDRPILEVISDANMPNKTLLATATGPQIESESTSPPPEL